MPFGSLWVPVLVSSVVVWLASAVVHMVLRYHKADYRGLPNEDAVAEVLRKGGAGPGTYVFPYCPDPKQMKDPATIARYEAGPVGILSILPRGVPAMPKYLGLWFGFCVLVGFVAAYVARHTLGYGADGMDVMRVTGTVAFTAYGLSHVSDSIWKGQPWGNTLRALLDAVLYAILTGLTFRFLWPAV